MTQTMVNTHPTQGFWCHYHSQDLIFQPKRGEWGVKDREIELAPRKEGDKPKKRMIRALVLIDKDKVCKPYTDVPSDAVKRVLEGEFASLNAAGGIDERHHNGAIRPFAAVHEEMTSKLEEATEARKALDLEVAAAKLERAEIQKDKERLLAERAQADEQLRRAKQALAKTQPSGDDPSKTK